MKQVHDRIEKPYFPFLLGNGVDAVLADYSGSMSCNSGHLHLEQHQTALCGWYKATHRNREHGIMPILQSSYSLYAREGEAYEVGEFEQAFDPRNVLLRTRVEACTFEIDVNTFLTKDHVLVERYRLKKVTPDRPVMALNLYPPCLYWTTVYDFKAKMEHQFSTDVREKTLTCDFEVTGIKGKAVLFTDYPTAQEGQFFGGPRLLLSELKKGMSITKYLVVLDENDTPDYEKEAERTIHRIRQQGYDSVLKGHQKEWEGFFQQSHINLPDKWMEQVYNTSLYQIRAHQNPSSGLISLGNYPLLWGGGISNSWDLISPYKGLLGANRVTEGERLISGYAQGLPYARKYASDLEAKGAYFPWFMNYKGESLYFNDAKECPNIEKFNNGCLVMEVWDLYRHTGDKRLLDKYWPLIIETTGFLVSFLVEEHEDIAYIREGEGADESVDRKNCSFHLITTLKALEACVESSKILNHPVDARHPLLIEKLKKGLRRNFTGKILMPFLGAKGITTQIFTSFLFNLPEGIPAESIEKGLKVCEGKWGLTNPGPYRNLIWPWAECKSAVVLSILKDSRAYDHLKKASSFTSTLGAFPEKIRPDRLWIGFWFMSAHGAYVWAINSMLVHSLENRLRILPGIPDSWKDLEFDRLRVPPGVLVSLSLRKGKLQKLILENQTDRNVEWEVEIFKRFLKPGRQKILSRPLLLKPRKRKVLVSE
jgi:hypothetical protein